MSRSVNNTTMTETRAQGKPATMVMMGDSVLLPTALPSVAICLAGALRDFSTAYASIERPLSSRTMLTFLLSPLLR